MKFFWAQNTCAIGIRVILEELGLSYEPLKIDFASKQQFTPEYSAVNPKRKVPALVRDDGTTVTEFQAIAFWLARSHPEGGLLAGDLEGQTRTMEVMDFIVASVHMRGFTFVLVPMKFTPNAEFQAEIAAHGKGQIAIGFERLAVSLVIGRHRVATPIDENKLARLCQHRCAPCRQRRGAKQRNAKLGETPPRNLAFSRTLCQDFQAVIFKILVHSFLPVWLVGCWFPQVSPHFSHKKNARSLGHAAQTSCPGTTPCGSVAVGSDRFSPTPPAVLSESCVSAPR